MGKTYQNWEKCSKTGKNIPKLEIYTTTQNILKREKIYQNGEKYTKTGNLYHNAKYTKTGIIPELENIPKREKCTKMG
jgi:hypothetical protein